MSTGRDRAMAIMVVEEVEEIRDGMERLLLRDGYCVHTARKPDDAIERAKLDAPDLILARLDGTAAEVISGATSIRDRAGLSEAVPVVAFCATCVPEGVEERVGPNVHVVSPDDFEQLRRLIARLLDARLSAG
ncbi:MAG TPA: hypothetical protein VKA54_07490 [Gemmatimonadaceae bacterium]|nr:hypothetical protein [Gemmatimonadaceae bacterium]